jgi:hypothetical protein
MQSHFTMTFPSFHFTSHPQFISLHLHFTSLHCIFGWFTPHHHFTLFIIFLTLFLKLLDLQERVPKICAGTGSCFQSWMVLYISIKWVESMILLINWQRLTKKLLWTHKSAAENVTLESRIRAPNSSPMSIRDGISLPTALDLYSCECDVSRETFLIQFQQTSWLSHQHS